MFFIRNGVEVILLLVSTQISVLAALADVKTLTQPFFKAITEFIAASGIDGIVSGLRSRGDSCAQDIAITIDALQAQKMWALQMLDASSKIQSGFLRGNLQNLGMLDECVTVNGDYNGTNIRGKYCRVFSGLASSAVCVPSSCNTTQVAELIEIAQRFGKKIVELDSTVDSVFCVPPKLEEFTFSELVTISFFSVVGAFIVFCTLCEYIEKYRAASASPVIHILGKFSLYTNAKTLFSTEVNPRMSPAIQGMKFISTCWILFGRCVSFMVLKRPANVLSYVEWFHSWASVFLGLAALNVDTLFVISGFLMTYSLLKKGQSGKKVNYSMMYLNRYLRLTPCIAVLQLFLLVLYHRFVYGPFWNEINNEFIDTCRDNWWVNLLYMQNLLRVEKPCLQHLWYLSVDMQLFWISPIILYPLHRWPKLGLGILCFLLVSSIVTPAVFTLENGYTNALIKFNVPPHKLLVSAHHFHTKTYNRASAYLVGVLLGYDVAKKKRRLTQVNVAVNWIVASICILICGLASQRLYDSTLSYDAVFESVFAGLSRFIWSIAIAWIVYACSFGYGGPVTRLLSLPTFLPLSRLSYCMYLTHPLIQGVRISVTQTSDTFSNFTMVHQLCGDIIFAILAALSLNLFVEFPLIVLQDMLTSRGLHRSAPREQRMDAGVEAIGSNKMEIGG